VKRIALRTALLWGGVWGLVFGVGACYMVFWLDLMWDGHIGNLTPPVAVLLGLLASCVGATLGSLSQLLALRSWAQWQIALVPAVAALLLTLAWLRGAGVWPRNDGHYLAKQIYAAQSHLNESAHTEAKVPFHPPQRAGDYEILIAGDQTPAWIIERPYERVWVQYPDSCGRIEADSPKPYSERTSLEMSSVHSCGGLAWGAGWSFFASSYLNVPVTLKVEKAAGQPAEIVLRKRERTRTVEVVELR
jgi:hypothetical protein